MLYQELPIPFPFYDSKEKQARHNVNSDEPCGASLITPLDALLPFQFRKSQTSELPDEAGIYRTEDDTLFEDVSAGLLPMLLATALETFDYFTHLGDRIPSGAGFIDMPPGNYYLKLHFPNDEEYYSESFRVPQERFSLTVPTDCKFIMLEWSNPSDIKPIHYNTSAGIRLINRVYLDSIIKNTEPEVEQEGRRNGDNELIPDFQKVTVKYRISDLVPDFLKLALSVMPVHDNIVLTTEYGKRSGQIYRVSTESQPESTGGYFSDINILFEQDLVVIRRGCNDVMLPPECPVLPISVSFLATPGTSAFTIIADLPAGMYADIYTALTASSTPVLSAAGVTRSQLLTGYSLPYTAVYGDYFVLRLKTFTCTVGDMPREQSSPALTYHPAVIAHVNAIENDPDYSGSAISGDMKGWLSDFVFALDVPGIFRKFDVLYPHIPSGNEEVSFSYNLMNPAANRITYPDSYTGITSQGIEFNGSSEYADTNFSLPAPRLTSAAMVVRFTDSIFLSTSLAGLAGAYTGTSSRFDMIFSGANFTGHGFDAGTAVTKAYGVAPTGPQVHGISRRSAADFEYYHDSTSENTNTGTQSGTVPAPSVWMGAVNGLPGAGFTAATFNFFAIGSGLTDGEWATFFSALDTFNANIGR